MSRMGLLADFATVLDTKLDEKLEPLIVQMTALQEQVGRMEAELQEKCASDLSPWASQVRTLQRFLAENEVSADLSNKIWSEVRKTTSAKLVEAQVQLLHVVPEPLLVGLHAEIYRPILTRHPLFERMWKASPGMFSYLCHVGVRRKTFEAGDDVFCVKEKLDTMCFVTSGCLEYHSSGESHLCSEGDWIAEMALWTEWEAKGFLAARTDSQLLLVYADALEECAREMGLEMKLPLSYYARSCLEQHYTHEGGYQDMCPRPGLALLMAESAFSSASQWSPELRALDGLRGCWSKFTM